MAIVGSTENLAQRGFDNTVSRYKIDGNDAWEFYDKPNFEGLLFTAKGPIGWTRVDGRYNDMVSFVSVRTDMLKTAAASQNNIGWHGVPTRAIDGITDGNYGARSCMHSEGSKNNWWMVTLAENSAVSKVVIHNRVDCCSERINGAKVYVGDVYCGEIHYKAGVIIYEVECGNTVGRSVKIVQNDQYLTLCEVEVKGAPSQVVPLANLARAGALTWQRSVGWSGEASRGIDGRSNGNYWDGSCTHSASMSSNMWKVDLTDDYRIHRVVIHNRVDCCADRINGVEVFVVSDAIMQFCGTVVYVAGKNVFVVDCAGLVGSEVMIVQQYNYLTLCEVQVLGTN